jgi:eukaryotic-like serine/threonine-protein kinase
MSLNARVRSAGQLVALAAALFATYGLFAAASMRVALKAREVSVPNLTGKPVNAATETLTEAGLTVRVEETRRPDPKVPAGHIVGQDPVPGSTIRRGRGIRLWVSGGVKSATIPRLVGESERAAQLRLAQDNLVLTGLADVRTDAYPPGVIIAQDPPADSKGQQVALLLNRGMTTASYVMPDLIGTNGGAAADLLRGYGFRITVVGEQPYPGMAAGIVLRQSPAAGFQISPGEPISLEVSR